jgi:hypothetical protein
MCSPFVIKALIKKLSAWILVDVISNYFSNQLILCGLCHVPVPVRNKSPVNYKCLFSPHYVYNNLALLPTMYELLEIKYLKLKLILLNNTTAHLAEPFFSQDANMESCKGC